MSDTPRTDAAHGDGRFANCVDVDFARELERELTAAIAEQERLRAGWIESQKIALKERLEFAALARPEESKVPAELYVPEGFKLVPIEPTVEMVDAGTTWVQGDSAPEYCDNTRKTWQAMIDASPDISPETTK